MNTSSRRRTTSIDAEIGFRIRQTRQERGLSQGELAAKIGVAYQQFQKYEQGTNRISAERLMQIASVLSVTPHDLLGFCGPTKDQQELKQFQELCDRVVNSRHRHLAIGLMQIIDDLAKRKKRIQPQHGNNAKNHSTTVE